MAVMVINFTKGKWTNKAFTSAGLWISNRLNHFALASNIPAACASEHQRTQMYINTHTQLRYDIIRTKHLQRSREVVPFLFLQFGESTKAVGSGIPHFQCLLEEAQ